ncbi:hypothetical protein KEM48_004587 [Puccinia striiformis f. sp. tritici PST-130]|nr:hypothetical protein KEM48_004587 [Puccinia striiformis f. sp. tritici PST-130]
MVGTIGRTAAFVLKYFKRKWLVAFTCILLLILTTLRRNISNFQSEVYDINERMKSLEIEVDQKSEIVQSILSASSNLVTKDDLSLFQAKDSSNGNSEAHRSEKEIPSNSIMDVFPRKNFASFPAGANILQSWTSPTWTHHLKSQSMFNNKRLKVEGNPPITVLISHLSLGTCWSFAGEKGQIGIQLTRVIHVTGITISHVSRFLAYDIRTAPNKFELWGLGFNGRKNLDLLHVGAYDIEAAQSVQYFAISSSQTRLYSKVLVKFRSNHGNPNLTCVYHMKIHGETREKLDGIGNLPEELDYLVPT